MFSLDALDIGSRAVTPAGSGLEYKQQWRGLWTSVVLEGILEGDPLG